MKGAYVAANSLLLISLTLTCMADQAIIRGDEPLAGIEQIKPFHGVWSQRAAGEDGWTDAGTIEERLELLQDGNWRHTQISHRPDSSRVEAIRILAADTLLVRSLEQTLHGFPDTAPRSINVVFQDHQIRKQTRMSDGQVVEAKTCMPFDGYDGMIFGLVLAALPLKEGMQYRLPSVMSAFMHGFWANADMKLAEPVKLADGKDYRQWRVDVEWLNINDGDIYPPGPDESGGSYYILENPPAGTPPVYRYVNNGVDITLRL